MKCRICNNDAPHFARATVLQRHVVEYFRCGACGFMQTQEPTWLAEAYGDAITASDIGLVGRNLFLRDVTCAVLSRCFDAGAHFLDYGGGYGLFTRLMRDRGFDFRWEDPFCKNIFAQEHVHVPDERYEVATAFEVFEHLPDPVAGVAEMAKRADSIFFSTELQPPGPPKPDDWWYYALDSGQHIAFYTRTALSKLGERHGMRLLTNGRNLHLLTKRSVSPFWFRLACSGRLAPLLARWGRRSSLVAKDHEALMEKLRG